MTLYVYGLMRDEEGAAAAAASERGLDTVVRGGLCALVEELTGGDLALRRESAFSHSQTLQEAFAHGPVLPMRFGTVLADAAALERELLEPRAEALLARLEALDGMSEMQVKATYREEPLLRSILAASPRLATTAARLRTLPEAATHFDRIALGEAIAAAVQSRRDAGSEQLLASLRGLAVAEHVSEPTHERSVVNAAFLVPDDRLEEFDAAVEELSDQHQAEMQFITGLLTLPLAPVRGVAWVAEKVTEEAERELYDERRIMRELAELEAANEDGRLSQDDFERGVDELLWRLELGRQLQLEGHSHG
jgi:hypothetical protein